MKYNIEYIARQVLDYLGYGGYTAGLTPEQIRQAREVFNGMDALHNTILRLRHMEGMSFGEIATRQECRQNMIAEMYPIALSEYAKQLGAAGIIEDPNKGSGTPRRSPRASYARAPKPVLAYFACPLCRGKLTISKCMVEATRCGSCGVNLRVCVSSGGLNVEILDVHGQAVDETEQPLTLKTACELLGVVPGATLQSVKKAYFEKIQQYHPDKVHHLGPEFMPVAERMSKRINRAWELIQAGRT